MMKNTMLIDLFAKGGVMGGHMLFLGVPTILVAACIFTVVDKAVRSPHKAGVH